MLRRSVVPGFQPCERPTRRYSARESNHSIDDFLRDAAFLPGLGIVGREQVTSDGTMELELEVLPGMPSSVRVTLRELNGQWKISKGL